MLLSATASVIDSISLDNDLIGPSNSFELDEKQSVVEKMPELTSKITKYVSAEDFQIDDFEYRMLEQEALNTYVFQRKDGTRTVYILDENVKYIDNSGKTVEKDITLQKNINGFGITKSNIDMVIPNNLCNGIFLSYGDYDVKLYPQNISSNVIAEKADNSVIYQSAFGFGTNLRYTPTLSGIKEDIILEKYVLDPSFTFTLQTNGLFIYENTDGYYLAANEKSEPIFYLGNVIVYDAVGKPEEGTASMVTVSEGNEYKVTISVNDEYLSDPTTVYPVTIDPSITIVDAQDGNNAIEDSPIYAGYPNRNFGTYLYNPIGTPDSNYGVGRTVVRLKGLINSGIYNSINASQITQVTFNAREASGTSAQYINLYPLTSNTTWTESTVTWNNVGSYSTSVNYGATMNNGRWAEFDITGLVKGWKSGSYSKDAGFILISANEASQKSYISSECSTTANCPYVVMTYSPNVSVTADCNHIAVGQTKTLTATTTPSGLSVTWSSSNTSVATVDSLGTVTGVAEGMVHITATYTYSGESYSGYTYLYVHDSLGIKADTEYYIMNYNSKRFLSLETTSDTNGANVHTTDRSSLTMAQWKPQKQSDGKFKLISLYSPTSKVLDVSGTNIDIWQDAYISYQRFNIYRVNTGTYKGFYVIRYGKYFVSQDPGNNVYITTESSDRSYWSFIAVEKKSAELICHKYTVTEDGGQYLFDTSTNSSSFQEAMRNIGYFPLTKINISATTAFDRMTKDDFYVFSGHGGPGIIGFSTTNNFFTGSISVNSDVASIYVSGDDKKYIEDYEKNALARVRCVLYLGCNTGKSIQIGAIQYNLVDATFYKGAHFVLGTTETMYQDQIDLWLDAFISEISKGLDVATAMHSANRQLGNIYVPYYTENGTEEYKSVYGLPSYYVGDKYQCFNYD